MEVASLPAVQRTSDLNDISGLTSSGDKRLLLGRPLPTILDNHHPESASRFRNSFRPPHTRHASRKVKDLGEGRSPGGGGTIDLRLAGLGGGEDGDVRRKEASPPRDVGLLFASLDGDPHLHRQQHHPYLARPAVILKTSSKSGPQMATTAGSAAAAVTNSLSARNKRKTRTGRPIPAEPPSASRGAGAGGSGSSTNSGVSSGGKTSEQAPRVVHEKLSRNSRPAYSTEGTDYSFNPDTVPFTSSNFMRYHGLLPFGYPRSSTMLKKISIPKRHQDTFGGYDPSAVGQRGVMIHTDRYQFEALEGLNQKDRLLAEMAYLDYLRGIKRRREVVPHRAELDLFLGGKKIECEERFDLQREIQRLKSMAMPVRARDLYHGRGIHLPPSHHSLVPRPSRLPEESDSDENEVSRVSAPASMQRPSHRAFPFDFGSPTYERQISLTLGELPRTRAFIRGKRYHQLPSLSKNQTLRTGMQREDTNMPRVPTNAPYSNRSPEDQTHFVSRHAKKQLPQPLNEGTFLTRQHHHVPLPPTSAPSEKRLTPEPPPPTTEGGVRRRPGPQKSQAPNPLKGGYDLGVSEEQVSDLRQTFQRLDTDMDGHLQYDELKSQLPAELSHQQECFLRKVYDITSSGAFFGVDEFMRMKQLTDRVASSTGPAQEAYGKIDFDTLEAPIIKYVNLFQEFDSSQKGRISIDSLKELIGKSQNKPPLEENSSVWNTILESLRLEYSPEVSWVEYLTHIPLFMTLAPLPKSEPERDHGEKHQEEQENQ